MKVARWTRVVALAAVLALASAGSAFADEPASSGAGDGPVAHGRPVDPDTVVPLTLMLRYPGRDALDRFVDEQRHATRPRALSASEIGERFGLPGASIDELTRRVEAAGLRLVHRYEQRTALEVEGRADTVERLFDVTLRLRTADDGRRYHVPSRPPTLPASWAGAVTSVVGLDNRPVWRPADSNVPGPPPSQGGEGLGGLTPADYLHAYDIDTLHDRGIDGRGQEVAIISLATLRGDENRLWAHDYHLSDADIDTVVVAPGAPGPDEVGWDARGSVEVALDIQLVRAIAPGARILNYTTFNDHGFIPRAMNRIVEDGRAKVASLSWGLCEQLTPSDARDAADTVLATAEAAGVNLFVYSGDYGVHGCYDATNPPTMGIAAMWPAASTHVVAVGGTTLFHDGGTYVEEAAWASPDAWLGAGGGTSLDQRRPSWQQAPGVDNQLSNAMRQVPDVAGPADPASGMYFVQWDPAKGGYVYGQAGGTSASAPFWAGITALYQQQLGDAGAAPLGDIKPLLYQIASSGEYEQTFRDIAQGANDYVSAVPGWDYITGLGTPHVPELADALVRARGGGG